MGYTTEYEGSVTVTPPLNSEEIKYLTMFCDTRRMNRKKGPYYVGGTGMMGQDHEADVIDYNNPPDGQPGLWCQWITNEEGTEIFWDGNEKFYYGAEWMQYLIDHFFGPDPIAKHLYPEAGKFLQSHKFEGIIVASGEDPNDHWRLRIDDDGVRVFVEEVDIRNGTTSSKPVRRQNASSLQAALSGPIPALEHFSESE